MNKRQPAIPERSSSLINANSQFDLKVIKTRKVSAMTTGSETSSVSTWKIKFMKYLLISNNLPDSEKHVQMTRVKLPNTSEISN